MSPRTRPKEDSNNGSVDEISKSSVIVGGNCDFISKMNHFFTLINWPAPNVIKVRELLFGGEWMNQHKENLVRPLGFMTVKANGPTIYLLNSMGR